MQQAPFARGRAKKILGNHLGKVSSLDRQDLDARLAARGRVGDLLRKRVEGIGEQRRGKHVFLSTSLPHSSSIPMEESKRQNLEVDLEPLKEESALNLRI